MYWSASSVGFEMPLKFAFWCPHLLVPPAQLCKAHPSLYLSGYLQVHAGTKVFHWGEKMLSSAQQTPGSFGTGVSLSTPNAHRVLFHILVLPPNSAQPPSKKEPCWSG